MLIITPEKRIQFAGTGWPKPVGGERCAAVTLQGSRCNKRRAVCSAWCQQHERRLVAKSAEGSKADGE